MAVELSYVLLTPYSIRKSRTGGIVSRLLSRTGLELVAARMFSPSAALVEKYAAGMVTDPEPTHRAAQEAIQKYVVRHFSEKTEGTRRRLLMLVFRGEDAVKKLREVAGHILNERSSGETIRDTFGDFITDKDGRVIYFEPAVLTAPDPASADRDLKLWAEYSDADGGLLEKAVQYPPTANVQKTLVLIKPDNFRFPNARPGGVIDLFSRTGLYIIACEGASHELRAGRGILRPRARDVLQDKLRGRAASIAAEALEPKFEITFSAETKKALGDLLGPHQWAARTGRTS